MARPSKIGRLQPEIRQAIAEMRSRWRTIDEIGAKLGELGVSLSRSALARHIKRLDDARPAGVYSEAETVRGSIDRLAAAIGDLRVAVEGLSDLNRQALARTDAILARMANTLIYQAFTAG